LLLSHCRPQKRFVLLLKTMYGYNHPEFQAFFQKKGTEFTAEQQPQASSRATPSYETVMIHNFDMGDLVRECLDSLLDKQGLIGFAVPCYSPIFLGNFCERLKYEWGRERIRLKPTLVIDPVHTPMDRAILTIERRYKPALKERDVLFAVQISEVAMLEHFWQKLNAALGEEDLRRRFIVVMALTVECGLPAGIISLGRPCFRKADVFRWISQVVHYLGWPEQIIDMWTDHMIAECSHEDELYLDWVYDHLGFIVDVLKQNPTLERFQQELERRRQLYA
jgi:hypothetical protein